MMVICMEISGFVFANWSLVVNSLRKNLPEYKGKMKKIQKVVYFL